MPYVYSHQALSGEGRAAKSLRGATVDDRSRWIVIQLNTFTNWSNEQLGRVGPPIADLSTDFSDGTRLIALVEALQKRTCTGKIYRNNPSEIQMLMNVQMALDALREDGVKLVNIGSHDIVEGNLKLILGLIWCLILRYQIASRTKIPPRKLMLAWIQAVIPELKISNFRTNWNDGKALSALLDYCQPGLFVHWRQLTSRDALDNCRRALQVAQSHFSIPQVVSPEDLSSPDLDELSCMTYMSYFMKREGPGYRATLKRVNQLIPEARVGDFQRTWNDGLALCHLVHAVGGHVPGWPNLRFDPNQWIKNLNLGLIGAKELGLRPLITASEMAEPDVEHLGVMVLAAELCSLPAIERRARTPPSPVREHAIEETTCHVNQQVNLDLAFVDGHQVGLSELDAVVLGPDGMQVREQTVQLLKTRTAKGAMVSLIPSEPGPYEVRIYCLGKELPSSPVRLNVLRASNSVAHSSSPSSQPASPSPPPIPHHHFAPSERLFDDDDLVAMPPPPPTLMDDYYTSARGGDIGHVSFSGLSEPCSIGSIVEVVINAHGDSSGAVLVEAAAPSGRVHKCQVLQKGNAYTATFTPNEVGEWQIGILYDSEHIRGSPFSCFVYDANLVQVYGLDVGLVGQELKFNVNSVQAGQGSIKVSVLHHGRVIPNTVDEHGPPGSGLYRVQFTPDGAGQYKIHVLFNNMEVKGSPFILDIADASSVSVYGDNLRMASVDKLSTFMIHAVGADSKDITVSMTAPSGKKKRARVVPIGDSAYRVEWKPVEAGEHYIDVRLYNQSVHDSPFTCNVGDPDLVTVRNMPTQIKSTDLGEDHNFEIDASAAGSGNLEIMINGGRVACKVRELGGRLYLAAFVPTQPVTHVIEMRFNGDPVKSSPWRVEFAHGTGGTVISSQQQQQQYVLAPLNMPGGLYSPYGSTGALQSATMTTIERETIEQASYAEISGVGLQRACVGKVASFDVGGQGLRSSDIEVKLTSPTGVATPTKVIASRTGDFRCEYVPTEVGAYRLEITIGGQRVDGSPFYLNAYAPHKVYIDPIPGGAVGKPVQFYVDANEAGKGQLEISVNQGRVPNNVQMQGSGRCLVTFIPQEQGTYVIDVTFNDELVRGCPVRVEITQKQVSSLTGDSKAISPLLATTHTSYTSSRTVEGSRTMEASRTMETSGAVSSYPRASTLMRDETSARRSPMTPPTPTSPTLVRHAQQRSSDKIDRISKDTPRSFVMVQRHQFEHGSAEKMDTTAYGSTESDRVFSTSVPRPWASPKETRKTFTTETSPKSQTFISSSRAVTHTRPFGDTERSTDLTSSTEETPPKTGKYEYKTSPTDESQFRSSSVRQWYDSRQKAYEEPASTTGLRSVSEQSALKTDPVGGTTVASYGLDRERISQSGKAVGSPYGSNLENKIETLRKSPEPMQFDIQSKIESDKKRAQDNFGSSVTSTETTVPRQFDIQSKIESDKKRAQDNFGSSVTSSETIVPIQTTGPNVRTIKTTYERFSTTGPQRASFDSELEKSREQTEIAKGEDQVDNAYRGMSTFDASAMRREGPNQASFGEYTGKNTGLVTSAHERDKDDAYGRSMTVDEEHTINVRSPHLPPFYRTQSTASEDRGIVEKNAQTAASLAVIETKTDELRKKDEMRESSLESASKRTAEFMRVKDEDERRFEQMGLTTSADKRKISVSSHSSSRSSAAESDHDDRRVAPPAVVSTTRTVTTSAVRSQQPEGELSPATQRRLQEQSLRKASDLRESDIPITTQLSYDSQTSVPKSPVLAPKSPALSQKNKTGKPEKQFDFGKSKFTTKHEVIKRGKEVEVKLEHLKVSKDDLKVVVIVPSKSHEKNELAPKVKKVRNGYEISFKPTEVGTHKIIASVNDSVHPQSPFPIRVYDSAEIDIGTIPNKCSLGDAVEFTVDAGRAGFGNLEIAIKDSDGVIIPSHVSQMDDGSAKFLVTFTPAHAGLHTVNITFNKEMLKSSPFEVQVIDEPRQAPPPVVLAQQTSPSAVQSVQETTTTTKSAVVEERRAPKTAAVQVATIADFPSMARVRSPMAFVVATKGAAGKLSLVATGPDSDRVPIKVVEEDDEMRKIEFVPKSVGDHSIQVKFADMDVRGSPFTCRVYDPAKIRVGDIPNGLVDKPVHFIVDASEAGVGNLEVAVNDGRVPSMAHSLGQHRYDISFVPRDSEDYTISIRFNNDPVPGSPFMCKILSSMQVTATGPGLERVPVGKTTHFNITIQDGNKGPPPAVNITDPHSERAKVHMQKIQSDGSSPYDDCFQVEYTPQTVGNHQIEIDYADEPISGSPFTAKAYDSKCAKLYPVEGCVVGRPATFIIDAARAGAGNMEIIVSVDGRNVPNFVQAEGQAKFKVSFTPQEAKEHVVSVRFNGEAIPGSPMKCPVGSEESKTKVIGLTAAAAKEVIMVGDVSEGMANEIKGFVVQTGGRQGDCNVVVTAPSGLVVDTIAHDVDNGVKFKFKPMEVGRHLIEVTVGGEKLKGSPFSMQVIDLELVRVSKIPPSAVVGRRYVFDIDTALAGEGRVRVEAKTDDDRLVPVELEKVDAVVYRASFRPREAGKHRISVLLNDRQVAEAAVVRVIDATKCATVTGDGLKRAQVDRTASFTLNVEKGLGKELAVVIVGPSGQSVPCRLQRESNEVYRADWQPKEVGEHRVSVTVADAHIPASPFTVNVLDLSAVRVIGLKDDRVGVEQRFNVDSSSAGKGQVTVRVSRQGETLTHEMRMVKDGLHVCTFTPSRIGVHKVHVFLDGVPLPECPYECDVHDTASVRAHGDALMKAQNGKTARFEVSMANAGRGELDVVISDPSGGPVPVKCYRQQDDSFWVEFTPQEIGMHTIEVTFADAPIAGSPFRCEVVDPKRVKIIAPTTPLVLRQEANVRLNRQGAGKGELSVEVTDPTGSPVHIETLRSPSGDDRISFLPIKLGEHKINVKMAGFQVQGSPQTLLVEEAGKPRATGAALDKSVQVGQVASITFDSKKSKGGLKVEVKGPKNKVKHTTSKKSDGVFDISFTPQEVGEHQVAISWNDKPISGSPFDVAVIDAEKVEIARDSLDSRGNLALTVFQRKEIDIDATMAGPGKLRAEVRGPNGTTVPGVQTQSLGYGKHRVTLVPRDAGEHSLFLFWSDLPVNNASPLIGWAESDGPIVVASTSRAAAVDRTASPSKDRLDRIDDDELASHLRVVLRGEGLTRAAIKEPAEFVVDGSDAEQDGQPACRLMGQKADVPVRLTHIGNRVYKATYTPLIAGKYELEVLWEGRQVRGSPFRVDVSALGEADNILVDSESLRLGIIHDEVKTTIDTRRAGPGQLSAQCMGPSKLAYCELYDHRDGTYTLCIRPSEVGKHTLIVKYSGEHVPGSPFTVNVSHPPDPSKVRVYGPGVEHGILSRFKSNFVVETKGAGAGQLTVRVRGPKGAFNVEMQRERKQDRTIHCKYEPREPGDYQVEVKWHGEHVPGSPFFVMIFDTQQELERFISGQPPSPQPPTPFVPPGWVGPPPPGIFLPPGGPPPHAHPPMLALPPPPPGQAMFPQHGMPYSSSTMHSARSSRLGGKKQASNGY